jgi:ATP-dependent Lon protease
MSLQDKIIAHFDGKVVRKDLSKSVKGNAVVPTYVLEYLLGQHCASFDESIINDGLHKVKDIIKNNFVHRDEAEMIKSHVRERGNYRLIDKITVKLNEKRDIYEASFSNLGINAAKIDDETVKKHPKLLTGGVWSIITLGYFFSDDKAAASPWIIENLKPIQISSVNMDEFKEVRPYFTKEEWLDLMIQTIGFNAEYFTLRDKLIQLSRLIPFAENNYNFIELGPKGTGKSHIFSELSPHGILLSGGDVTEAKLFVNNASGKIGLVGFWDTVAFDEFAGSQKQVDRKLVDIMKNYMANKSFSRGRDVYGANASMVFIGNTEHSVNYMLKHNNLFSALPKAYYDTAFLDRIHTYIPGWEVKKLRNEMLTDGYGFIVDYIAEILRELRKEDFSHLYKPYFSLPEGLTTRDRNAIDKTFSGLMKIIYPDGNCSKTDIAEILAFALESRKRVKDQLIKMDDTFEVVHFGYTDLENEQEISVECLEIIDFQLHTTEKVENNASKPVYTEGSLSVSTPEIAISAPLETLKNGEHKVFKENQKGISYKKLFAKHLQGAKHIHLFDPYLQHQYQIKNLMEFCQMLLDLVPEGEELIVEIFTKHDEIDKEKARTTKELLDRLCAAFENTDLKVSYQFDLTLSFHARSIETDTAWKISIDRGLDIFQMYNLKDVFALENMRQEARAIKGFEVSYLRL